MQKISLLACLSENNVLGNKGQLIYRIKDDLKRFKALTIGKTVVMGRKTYESIGRPLPDRTNVVLSQSKRPEDLPSELIWVNSLEECENQLKDQEVFVIGGGEIYNAFLHKADEIYLTVVHRTAEGDAFFPPFDESKFEVIDKEEHLDSDPPFTYITYIKK